MKIKYIMMISAIILLAGCADKQPVGADQAGVWSIAHFTDSFGDLTEEPYLKGVIPGGEFIGSTFSHWNGTTKTEREGRLFVRVYYYRSGKMVTQGKKKVPEEIPGVDMRMSYLRVQADSAFYVSNLWKQYNSWDIKVETESMPPFTGKYTFKSKEDYYISFFRGDAQRIIDILTQGEEVKLRAKCREDNDQDEYTFKIDERTLEDFRLVFQGYLRHYDEYVKSLDQDAKK